MLRVWCGAALVLTTLFATANMALSREWEAGEMDSEWQVVFTQYVLGVTPPVAYIMNLDGSNVQPLMVNSQWITDPDCSPNGNALTFVSAGSVYVVTLGSSEELNLVHLNIQAARELSVASDNTEVLFRGILNGRGDRVFLVNRVTSVWSELTDILPNDSTFAHDLSPDGKRVAYQNGYGHFYILGTDGNMLMEHLGAYHPTWSPNGNLIAFTTYWDGNSNIYTMDVDRALIVQLTHQSDGSVNSYPFWSPDGRQILYLRYSNSDSNEGDIYVMNANASNQRLLIDMAIARNELTAVCILASRPTSLVANP